MPENCNDCPLEPRVTALERANEQHSKTHREVFDRLRALETQTAVQENKLDTILRMLNELTEKVDALEAKPGKRWETFIAGIISALGGAFVMWVAMGMPGAGS